MLRFDSKNLLNPYSPEFIMLSSKEDEINYLKEISCSAKDRAHLERLLRQLEKEKVHLYKDIKNNREPNFFVFNEYLILLNRQRESIYCIITEV